MSLLRTRKVELYRVLDEEGYLKITEQAAASPDEGRLAAAVRPAVLGLLALTAGAALTVLVATAERGTRRSPDERALASAVESGPGAGSGHAADAASIVTTAATAATVRGRAGGEKGARAATDLGGGAGVRRTAAAGTPARSQPRAARTPRPGGSERTAGAASSERWRTRLGAATPAVQEHVAAPATAGAAAAEAGAPEAATPEPGASELAGATVPAVTAPAAPSEFSIEGRG